MAIAAIAARVLKKPTEATITEIKKLAATALTQVKDKAARVKPKARD
jgi:hypothetical protein